MKIKLLKDARVHCAAGTVVDTDSVHGEFLCAVGVAVPVKDEAPAEQAPAKAKKATKK